jgi:hypothetical protein
MKLEAAALSFLALEELGEVMVMRYGRMKRPDDPPLWDYVPHVQFDGIGGFADILRRYEQHRADPIHAREASPPSLRTVLRGVRGVLDRARRSASRPGVPWERYERDVLPGIPTAVGWAVLDEEETKRVQARLSTSTNSRLLWALDKAIAPLVAGAHPPRLWLVPVNMRHAAGWTKDLINAVTPLPVEFEVGASPDQVHAAIKQRFEEGAHWATLYLHAAESRLAPARMQRSAVAYHRRPRHAWLGTFSNLGDWSVPGRPANWIFIGVPPVTLVHPISSAALTWGGRMTLTLQTHRAISEDPALATEMASTWKRLALEASS